MTTVESEAAALLVMLSSALESKAAPRHWLQVYEPLDSRLPFEGDGPLLEMAKMYRTKKRGHQQRIARANMYR